MEQRLIAIIDYDMGNLGSITNALRYVSQGVSATPHIDVILTRDPEIIRHATHIVLPGVGAFGSGMENLRTYGLIPLLEEEVMVKKKPFLGVCLGMQVLATRSFEFGEHEGLGWIPGEVRMLKAEESVKVPHVGWNDISIRPSFAAYPLFREIPDHSDFYFVHSYRFENVDPAFIAATCEYGETFPAVLIMDNICAVQFHPEKSQKHGLRMLENFVAQI